MAYTLTLKQKEEVVVIKNILWGEFGKGTFAVKVSAGEEELWCSLVGRGLVESVTMLGNYATVLTGPMSRVTAYGVMPVEQ